MFYDRLYFTKNLRTINYLTQKGHPIVKIKRDYKSDVAVYIYFDATEQLIADLNDFKTSQEYLGNTLQSHLETLDDGFWTSQR